VWRIRRKMEPKPTVEDVMGFRLFVLMSQKKG